MIVGLLSNEGICLQSSLFVFVFGSSRIRMRLAAAALEMAVGGTVQKLIPTKPCPESRHQRIHLTPKSLQ